MGPRQVAWRQVRRSCCPQSRGVACRYTGGHGVSKLVVEVQRARRLKQETQEAAEEVITGEGKK